MKATLFFAVVLLSVSALAKNDNLEWKTGVLIDQSADESRCKTHGDNGSVRTTCATLTLYKVDAGDFIYTGQRDIHTIWDKRLDVTVNAPIQYAIRGHKLFIKDESGKPHELTIVQKAAKQLPK